MNGHGSKTARTRFGQCSQAQGEVVGVSVQGQDFISMLLVGAFQLRRFCDSVSLLNLSAMRDTTQGTDPELTGKAPLSTTNCSRAQVSPGAPWAPAGLQHHPIPPKCESSFDFWPIQFFSVNYKDQGQKTSPICTFTVSVPRKASTSTYFSPSNHSALQQGFVFPSHSYLVVPPRLPGASTWQIGRKI